VHADSQVWPSGSAPLAWSRWPLFRAARARTAAAVAAAIPSLAVAALRSGGRAMQTIPRTMRSRRSAYDAPARGRTCHRRKAGDFRLIYRSTALAHVHTCSCCAERPPRPACATEAAPRRRPSSQLPQPSPYLLQDTDDEQDVKKIEVVPFPYSEQPEDKNELQVRACVKRFIISDSTVPSWRGRVTMSKRPIHALPPLQLQALIIQDLKTEDDSQPGGFARRRVQKGLFVVVRGSDDKSGNEATWVALVNKVGRGGLRCWCQRKGWGMRSSTRRLVRLDSSLSPHLPPCWYSPFRCTEARSESCVWALLGSTASQTYLPRRLGAPSWRAMGPARWVYGC